MGWNGDCSFVMYGFVKQGQPCNLFHMLLRLPVKTVQGMHDTAFPSVVRPCDVLAFIDHVRCLNFPLPICSFFQPSIERSSAQAS